MHGCTVMVFERRISPADIEIRTPTPSSSTGWVMIGNRAACAFAGIVTVLGTLTTSGRLLARVTIVPPSGAGVLSATKPCAAVPPATDGGKSARVLWRSNEA